MNTQNSFKSIRNTIIATVAGLGITLLVSLAGAQEVADGAVNKGAMKNMSRLKEAGVVTVTGKENWGSTLGFGKDSNTVEMMTRMMVGGSGMEHMKMAGMNSNMRMGSTGAMEMGVQDTSGMPKDAAQGLPALVTLKQNPPAVGDNVMDVLIADASGKPVTGLKLMATVAMTSMDMGTEHPKLVEGKDGHYAVLVKFSMKGPWRVTLENDGKADKSNMVHSMLDFNVDGKTKWIQPKPMVASKMPPSGATSGDWNVTVNTDPKALVVGKNMLDVTILDAAGKPVTGAKVLGSVEMTSMDMGVTKTKTQEGKNGHYIVPVDFSMKGPWRVTLTVTPAKQKPFTKALEFKVGQ